MNNKDHKTFSMPDQTWFSSISRPSRYLGNEINRIKKDPASVDVSIALAFPDIYEVGMSHLGLKILYHLLNSQEWIAAERAYCPWVDLEKTLRSKGLPLTTIESDRPLSNFDIVGFSIQYELSFSNILNMLDLSGIPFLSEDRGPGFPLIIGGGPVCFNPEPIASIFDALVVGDGEEAAVEICRTVRETKLQKIADKREVLYRLAQIKGIYVPSFFQTHYSPHGGIDAIEALIPEYREVEKAIIPDIDAYDFPTSQVVPFVELIHDRLAIEISRGCTRGCRFCQAGMIYRPVRERHPDSVIEHAETGLRLTGFEELSLLSLSSGDYSCIGPLIKTLMDKQSREKIAVSLPSLRMDSLDPEWIEQIKRVRKTGFTLAPEAGNDRLRRVINKDLTNEDIIKTAREVYGAGWNLMKLYFMIGLPGEEEKDLEDIISLSKQIIGLSKGGGKRAKLNVSLSTFVPKSHTPFMWMPQITLEESRRRIRVIREGLKNRRIRVKWNTPEMSWLEGIFSRGDRRLTPVLIEAWKMGARFDAWTEHYDMEIWLEALKRTGLVPEFYLHRSRSKDEILPWDHIQSGISKEYFKKEWQRAMQGKETPDCRKQCLACGVCDHKQIDMNLCAEWAPPQNRKLPLHENDFGMIKKYRLTFSKTGPTRYLSHLEMVRLFIRSCRRAGLKFVYSEGYHPMPKVSFASALPVGTESIHETVDIKLYEAGSIASLRERLGQQLPNGIGIVSIEDITHHVKRTKLKESHFNITINGLKIERRSLEDFLKSDHFPILKMGKKGEQLVDARPLIKSIRYIPPHDLNLVVNHLAGPGLKPTDIIKGILHLKDHQVGSIKILKTGQVME
jgi:radical SAM family uncharacterized protein/radical SAM-linked protein